MTDSTTSGHLIERPREAIIRVAREILAAEGMAGLSMRTVADRVGVSATALYHYFDSKQALVTKVVERGFRRFNQYLESAMEGFPAGSFERLAAMGEAYIRFALENEEYYRVIFSLEAGVPRTVEDLPAAGGYHLTRSSVQAAIESGVLRPEDPDLITHYLWSLAHGLVTLELACRLHTQSCEESLAGGPDAAVELFKRFRGLVADGLLQPVTSTTSPDLAS